MKRFPALAAAALAALLLAACGGRGASPSGMVSPKSDPAIQSPAPSPADSAPGADGEQPAALEDTQTIGSEEFGYVTIPGSWALFRDVSGGTDLQYSDEQGQAIITLNVFSDEGLTEEQKAQLDAQLAAQSVWYDLEQSGVQDIEGAQVTLAGYDAFQLYGVFASEAQTPDSVIVCWVFQDENAVLHYIAAEAPAARALEVVGYVEGSYSLAAPAE